MLRLFIAILIIANPLFSFGQKRCSTMEAEKLRVKDRRLLPGNEVFEKWLSQKMEEQRNKLVPFGFQDGIGEPDKIAVVVHVIHNGEDPGVGVNITDEQILSQIEVLNEDFQRMNADTLNTQAEFLDRASKLNIEFVLARQDEIGDPTTGIIRKTGTKTSYDISVADRLLLSSISQWDPSRYLNIWVTDLAGQNIGLAQFPDFGETGDPINGLPGLDDKPNKDDPATDGLIIDYKAFGSVDKVPWLDLKTNYDRGRSATHEIGHFFGLLHTWGDGGCTVDDYVTDTPNSDTDYLGNCQPADHVSCGSNDMFENYMYYTDDACMNIFTNDQVSRMITVLEYAPRRASLINSSGTEYPDDLSFDLAIKSVLSPGTALCNGDFTPVIEVKNNGGSGVNQFDILVTLNDIENEFFYTGDSIKSGETIQLEFDMFTGSTGANFLEFELKNIPLDVNPANNVATHSFVVDNKADFIPLREEFTASSLDMTNWVSLNEDQKTGWEIIELPYVSGSNTAYINLYNYEDRQQIDWLISPVLDFSAAQEASMTFKTSYAKNTDFNDQLQIAVSENCDGFFNTILETYNSTDLSLQNSENFWEPESRNDWQEHSIDLMDYAGESDIRIAFKVINDYGNNLYLDDIEFYTTAEDKRVSSARNSYTLYPNPTSNGQFQLAFNTSGRQLVSIYIYDQLGKIISYHEFPNTLNQTYYYDLSGQRAGVYYIQARGEDFVRSKKIMLTR